jgi:L-fuconolactonase
VRIDAHQHFWHYDAQQYAWIDGSMGVLQRDWLPADLEPWLRAAGRDGCVAVQARTDEAETRWLLQLAEQHDWIRGVVGFVDLTAADARERIAALRHPRLVGLRHVLQAEPDAFFARADFRRGLATLAEFSLAYDVLVHAPQLPLATDLCRAFPGQRFVLDHLAKPRVRTGEHATWARDLRAFAALPATYCKLSGLATEADWRAWTEVDLVRYLDTALATFGPDRLLFGSDWPVCLCAVDYARWAELVDRFLAPLTARERAAIEGATAASVYRLPTAP